MHLASAKMLYLLTNQESMDNLTKIYKKLLRETDTNFFRYLYSEIDWNNRIVGIRGPRGVGKTTLMLQHIKKD